MQDIAVVSSNEGALVALAGAAGVVLYSLQKNEATPGLSAWKMSQRSRLCHMWPACAVSMSADGSTLAAAALGGQLCVWDLRPGLDAVRLELQVSAFRQPLSLSLRDRGVALPTTYSQHFTQCNRRTQIAYESRR